MGSRGLATPAFRSGPVPSSERGVAAAGGCVTQARSAVSLLSFRLKYLLHWQEKCQKQHHVLDILGGQHFFFFPPHPHHDC